MGASRGGSAPSCSRRRHDTGPTIEHEYALAARGTRKTRRDWKKMKRLHSGFRSLAHVPSIPSTLAKSIGSSRLPGALLGVFVLTPVRRSRTLTKNSRASFDFDA